MTKTATMTAYHLELYPRKYQVINVGMKSNIPTFATSNYVLLSEQSQFNPAVNSGGYIGTVLYSTAPVLNTIHTALSQIVTLVSYGQHG